MNIEEQSQLKMSAAGSSTGAPGPTGHPESASQSKALLEDIRAQVVVIAEGHGTLRNRLEETDVRLARLEGQLDQLEVRVIVSDKSIHTKLDALEVKYGVLNTKVDALDARLSGRLDVLDKKVDIISAELWRVTTQLGAVTAHLAAIGASLGVSAPLPPA